MVSFAGPDALAEKRKPTDGVAEQCCLAWAASVGSAPTTVVKDGWECSCSATRTVQSRAEARRWVRASRLQYDTISRSKSVDRLLKKGVLTAGVVVVDVAAMMLQDS